MNFRRALLMAVQAQAGGPPPAGRTLLAVATSVSPYLRVWERDGSTFTQLPNPATLPPTLMNDVALSPDLQYLTLAGDTAASSPTWYSISGTTLTKLTVPASVLGDAALGTAISPDGTQAVFCGWDDAAVAYSRSGSTLTRLTGPTDSTGITGNGLAFSPDGIYLAVAHSASPRLRLYKRSGASLETYTRLANPSPLPAGNGNGVCWSPDGNTVALAHATTPFLSVYTRTGDALARIAGTPTLPGTGFGAAFSPDGNYLAIAHAVTPFVSIFARSGDTFTKIANPDVLPNSTGRDVKYSADGAYLAVAHLSGTMTLYAVSGETYTKQAITVTGLGDGYGVDFVTT